MSLAFSSSVSLASGRWILPPKKLAALKAEMRFYETKYIFTN